jgi:hypothetical protein
VTATADPVRDRAILGAAYLQDLIGLRLVYSDQIELDRAEAAVTGMEAYLHQGALPQSRPRSAAGRKTGPSTSSTSRWKISVRCHDLDDGSRPAGFTTVTLATRQRPMAFSTAVQSRTLR